MDFNEWNGYVDWLEDLGQQMLDLVAEMRADPPQQWPKPGLGAIKILGMTSDVPKKRG